MFLVCRTSDNSARGLFSYAVLTLDRRFAKMLATDYRKLAEAAVELDDDFYCLDFLDGAVDYGDVLGVFLPEDPWDQTWWGVTQRPQLDTRDSRTSVESLLVTRRGVLWSAWAKHTDDYFETPEITWDELQALAEGRCPFPMIPAVKENPHAENVD